MSPRKNGFEVVAPRKETPLFENADLVSAHAEIVRTLNEKRIKEESFRHVYRNDVDSDIRSTRGKIAANAVNETGRDRWHKAISDLLEGLIYKGINEGGWLGKDVTSFPTALFDDYVNGVDQIIDFHYPETDSHAYLGLAIDVTTGNVGTVYEKFEKIKKSIDRDDTGEGSLATIKYFSRAHFHGVVRNVPQAVVGIEPSRVERLALDWKGKHESLGQSPIKRLLLMQMRLQMETFASYAEWKGKPELTKIFLQDERRLKAILDNTPIGKDDMVDLSNDDVFHSIHQALSLFRVPLKSV